MPPTHAGEQATSSDEFPQIGGESIGIAEARMPMHPRHIMRSSVLSLIAHFAPLAGLAAQLPGAPVLQNAWASPGIVIALDIGGGSGTASGSTYAGAAAWSPANGGFQLSAGAGANRATGSASRGVYGVRAAMPVLQMMSGNLGVAAFVGVGGGSSSATDSLRASSVIPAGLAIGYRRSVGSAGGGFSIYADPHYQYQSGARTKKGYVRIGAGVDAGITSRFGVTVGFESGATAAAGSVGPRGTLFGVGASMKIGR
jgi:hypothetical protein